MLFRLDCGTDWRFNGFVPIDPYRPSGLGGVEHAGMTVRDKQGAVEGVWSNVDPNFDFGVRERDMGRS
jgi:hypothetical protein